MHPQMIPGIAGLEENVTTFFEYENALLYIKKNVVNFHHINVNGFYVGCFRK